MRARVKVSAEISGPPGSIPGRRPREEREHPATWPNSRNGPRRPMWADSRAEHHREEEKSKGRGWIRKPRIRKPANRPKPSPLAPLRGRRIAGGGQYYEPPFRNTDLDATPAVQVRTPHTRLVP